MAIRIGGLHDATSVIGPPNQGLGRYAQARLDNTVARAVRRHAEALRVDGIKLQIWVRRNAGLPCTCRQPQKALSAEAQIIDPTNPDDLRKPRLEVTEVPAATDDPGDTGFKIYHMRGRTNIAAPQTDIPAEFASVINPEDDPGQDTDPLMTNAPLNEINSNISDDQLALLYSEGGAVFGGDKTACGICFGTGRVHGYQYISGRRIILDASNEWVYALHGSAEALGNLFPTQFSLVDNKNCWVEWLVDLPAYTNGWLALTPRNNLQPALGVKLEYFISGAWQPLTLAALIAGEGTDRRGTRIRAITDGTSNIIKFTHVEMICSMAEPILAQAAQLTSSTNFDFNQPTITTEFEILGAIDALPRESAFQDSKYKYLWKVLDSTPKLTASGQIFGFTVNARNVHNTEMLYALRLLTDPAVTVNYRGIERVEGGFTSQYYPESQSIPNDFTMPEYNGDAYNTEES